MQHHLPDTSRTAQHEAFLNEQVSTLSRFRRVANKVHPAAIERLDYRRERQVFFLADGKRSIGQIASLLGMHPVDVASMMKQLLALGYVELLHAPDHPTTPPPP